MSHDSTYEEYYLACFRNDVERGATLEGAIRQLLMRDHLDRTIEQYCKDHPPDRKGSLVYHFGAFSSVEEFVRLLMHKAHDADDVAEKLCGIVSQVRYDPRLDHASKAYEH